MKLLKYFKRVNMKLFKINRNIVRWFIRDFTYKYLVPVFGRLSYLTYLALRYVRPNLGFKLLLMSSRYSHSKLAMRSIAKNLNAMQGYIVDSLVMDKNVDQQHAIDRSIVLQNPEFKEDKVAKGVLLITFTTTFTYYINNINNRELLKYFHLVLEPSWAGYALPEILFWAKFADGPIVVQSTEPKDFELIQGLKSSLLAVTFGASDWVDHRVFKPLDLDKDYESIYVANFNAIKRHHVYFRALSKLRNTSYKKSALVCGKWGEQIDEVYDLIKYYDLEDVLDVYVGLNQTELNALLNRAKVNLLMSLKEGSNRSIFEGFYSGVPAIMLEKNIGVNKGYVNKDTGMIIKEKELASALQHFSTKWTRYDPRKWSLDNISAIKTTEKLTNIFSKSDSSKNPIAVKVNAPEVNFLERDEKPYYLDCSVVMQIFGNLSADSEFFSQQLKAELAKLPIKTNTSS